MKTGINAWSIKTDADFEEAFSHAKAAGFDGIELNVDANNAGHSLTFGTTDAELDEIMAISEKHSLPVSSISTSLWAGKMGQGNRGINEILRKTARNAAQIREAPRRARHSHGSRRNDGRDFA